MEFVADRDSGRPTRCAPSFARPPISVNMCPVAGPFDIESCLIEPPAVAESGVIGKADAERGEIVVAFVVLHPDHKASPDLALKLRLAAGRNARSSMFMWKYQEASRNARRVPVRKGHGGRIADRQISSIKSGPRPIVPV